MNQAETERFNHFYDQQQKTLKLQGMSKSTISSYSRAIRRVTEHFDCCPDKLEPVQLQDYFADLVDSHP